MNREPTYREKLTLLRRKWFGKRKTIIRSTMSWKKHNRGPWSLATHGRPTFYGPLTLLFGMIAYLVVVSVINWDITIRLAADPNYVTEINFYVLEMINAPMAYVGYGVAMLAGYMGLFLHLNSWNDLEYQIEPCMVETKDGEIITPVIRVISSKEIWPPKKGSKFEEFLEELTEEEILKLLEDENFDLNGNDGDSEKGKGTGTSD